MLSIAYKTIMNDNQMCQAIAEELQCVPTEFTHHYFWLTEQILLAKNYFNLERFTDAKNCLQKAMSICHLSKGVEENLFFKLFPKVRHILYTVSIFLYKFLFNLQCPSQKILRNNLIF